MTHRRATWWLSLVLLACGCGTKEGPVAVSPAAPTERAVSDVPRRPAAPRETWESIHIQGVKIGYIHQRSEVVDDGQQPLQRTSSKTQMTLQRGGDTAVLDLETVSFDTLDGRLVRFESTENQAGNRRVQGEADASGIDLSIHTLDKVEKQRIEWAGEPPGGFWVETQSLRDKPLQPGETRRLRKLEPYFYQLAEVTLAAQEYEEVDLPTGKARLLRVEYTNSLVPDNSIMWIDSDGEVLRTELPYGQTVYRTSKESALAAPDEPAPDLAVTSLVPVDGALPRPQETVQARYRISVQGLDPTELFPGGATQQVRALGNNTAELVVTAVDPATAGNEPEPAEEFREANAILQSDAARIQELAQTAVGDATEPAEVAVRLERWVYEHLSQKNMKVAFVTAADVAEQLEGDCTEHAVLLAAMARAVGLPSRVVVGLIAVQDGRAFGFHAWTEVYVHGKWLPLDGTLGRGRVGAGHIKLGDSSMRGADALSLLLPVARVLNRVRIEVVDYQYK